MWSNHQIIFQDHVECIHNAIVDPFIVGIFHYTERVREMHDLTKYLHPPPMKGGEYNEAYWAIRDKDIFDN